MPSSLSFFLALDVRSDCLVAQSALRFPSRTNLMMRSSCGRWLSESSFSRCIVGPFPVLLQRPLWESIIGHSAHAPYGNPWMRLSSRGGRASGLRYPAGNALPETDGAAPDRLSRLDRKSTRLNSSH